MLKLPPKIKVLEALSAVQGGRISIVNEKEAIVKSSDSSRTYKVHLDLDKMITDSTDNGTRYKGYIGYPIIAFLMMKNILPVDNELGEFLKYMSWKKLNEEFKSYDKVMEYVKRLIDDRGGDSSKVDKYIDSIMIRLRSLKLKKTSL